MIEFEGLFILGKYTKYQISWRSVTEAVFWGYKAVLCWQDILNSVWILFLQTPFFHFLSIFCECSGLVSVEILHFTAVSQLLKESWAILVMEVWWGVFFFKLLQILGCCGKGCGLETQLTVHWLGSPALAFLRHQSGAMAWEHLSQLHETHLKHQIPLVGSCSTFS